MDASQLPKGQSAERTDGRPINLPGIYRHTATGAEYITSEGEEGIVQADALMSEKWKGNGWERVGDVPSKVELLERRKAQVIKDQAAEAAQKKLDEAEIESAVKVQTEKLTKKAVVSAK